jgi:glycosyltransferase involved in cell wall biosynthesis
LFTELLAGLTSGLAPSANEAVVGETRPQILECLNWLALNNLVAPFHTEEGTLEIAVGERRYYDGQSYRQYKAQSYRERYPHVIRVLERSKNVGIQRNTYETLDACRGKYTAWLDADDYWTDPEKLAIQVDTLESDATISVCGHFTREVTVDGQIARPRVVASVTPGRYGIDELLRHNLMTAAAVMFRTGIHRQLPAGYFQLKSMSDWPLWVLAARSGDIVLLDRVMADQMLTPNSSFTTQGPLFRHTNEAEFYELVESMIPSQWRRLVRAEKGKRYESIAYLLRKQGDFTASREAAVKAFCSPSLTDNLGSKMKALLAAVVREAEWRLKGAQSPSRK